MAQRFAEALIESCYEAEGLTEVGAHMARSAVKAGEKAARGLTRTQKLMKLKAAAKRKAKKFAKEHPVAARRIKLGAAGAGLGAGGFVAGRSSK